MAIEGISSKGNTGTTSFMTTEVKASATAKTVATKVDTAPDQAERKTEPGSQTAFIEAPTAEEVQKNSQPSENAIRQAIADINKKINANTTAEYGYHDKTNTVIIKIVDKDSNKVIREYPAEETLDMIAKVWELAGMFLDEKR